MKNSEVILHLSLIDSIGPCTIQKLLDTCCQENVSLSALYDYTLQDFVAKASLSPDRARLLYDGLRSRALLEREQALLYKHAIHCITIVDDNYPPLLRNAYGAPAVLYVKGASHILGQPSVALVGSRQAGSYAQQVIKKFVPPLVQQGVSIVSGGALGADTMAHQEALQAHGTTVVVLGSGLLRPYPSNNKPLFEMIAQDQGAIISPFCLESQASAGNFPARNRIIAGLSQACVVIQAAQKSGALITARYSLEYARDVFAVPGSIVDPLSAGCHDLIAQGAMIATQASDILDKMGLVSPSLPTLLPAQKTGSSFALDDDVQEPDSIVRLARQPISLDELIEKSGLAGAELHEKLFELQLKGKISQNIMGLWHAR